MAPWAWFSSQCLGCASSKELKSVSQPTLITSTARHERTAATKPLALSVSDLRPPEAQQPVGHTLMLMPKLSADGADDAKEQHEGQLVLNGGSRRRAEDVPADAFASHCASGQAFDDLALPQSISKGDPDQGTISLPAEASSPRCPDPPENNADISPSSCDCEGCCGDNPGWADAEMLADGQRKRDKIRRLGRRVRTKFCHRFNKSHEMDRLDLLEKRRRPSWIEEISPEVVDLKVPSSTPIVTEHLATLSVEAIHRALNSNLAEQGPLATFLREGLGVFELQVSPWMDGMSMPGTLVQQKRYVMPMPNDTPEMLRKALKLPQAVPGHTISCLGLSGNSLILAQHSRSEGVLFSERVRFQNTHVFRPHPAGGVEWCQWTETIWLEPLPWTQSFLAKAIQMKAAAEARGASRHFVDALLAAASSAEVHEAH